MASLTGCDNSARGENQSQSWFFALLIAQHPPLYRALKPKGVLVIDAIMTSDQPMEWASRATLLMNTWHGGSAYSFSDYRTWLEGVGFSKVTQHNEQLLSAVK